MRIDKKLNLALKIERDAQDGGPLHLHSTPISRETFERYHMVIAKTFTTIYGQGLEVIAGPRTAHLILKDVATALGRWEGPEGVENGLMNEIRRLTNVVVPGAQGWEILPFADAIKRDYLSEDDVSEAEALIVFFIVNSAMLKRDEAPGMLAAAADLWGAQVTSSTVTELRNSLPTSTATATSQASAPQPQAPPRTAEQPAPRSSAASSVPH